MVAAQSRDVPVVVLRARRLGFCSAKLDCRIILPNVNKKRTQSNLLWQAGQEACAPVEMGAVWSTLRYKVPNHRKDVNALPIANKQQ